MSARRMSTGTGYAQVLDPGFQVFEFRCEGKKLMLLYENGDIRSNINSAYLSRGRNYQRQGRVLDVYMSADGKDVSGSVRGSGHSVYHQNIKVRFSGGRVDIDGDCTCPVGRNCKHVAAVLLEGLEEPMGEVVAAPASVANDNATSHFAAVSLGSETSAWLDGLQQLAPERDPNDYPDDMKQRLLFIINPGLERTLSGYSTGPAMVQLMSVRLLKNGSFGATRSVYDPGRVVNYQVPKYLRPVDLDIMRDLYWLKETDQSYSNYENKFRFDQLPDGAKLLQTMLKTGRAYLGSPDGPRLSLSSKRTGELSWRMLDDGAQKLEVSFEYRDASGELARPDLVLPMSPPFYVDVLAKLCGPLDLGLGDEMAGRMLAAPPITAREAPLMVKMFKERVASVSPAVNIPLPKAPKEVETRQVRPTPVLRLLKGELKYDPGAFEAEDWRYRYYSRTYEKVIAPLARLSFDYEGLEVAYQDKTEAIEHIEDDRLILVMRDQEVEKEALKLLGELEFQTTSESRVFFTST